jgi:hypothetical protein
MVDYTRKSALHILPYCKLSDILYLEFSKDDSVCLVCLVPGPVYSLVRMTSPFEGGRHAFPLPGPGHFRREGTLQTLLATSCTWRLAIVIFNLTFDFSLTTRKTGSIGTLELVIQKLSATWRSLLLIACHHTRSGFLAR